MSSLPWIAITIGVVLALLLVLLVWKRKEFGKRPVDYYGFFWIGLVWTIFGILMMFFSDVSYTGFTGMGVIFLAIGAANKDKWKDRKKWGDLDPKEKKIKMIMVTILGLAVVVGLIVYVLANV